MTKIGRENIDKSVFGGNRTVRVAAIQAPQIVFNKDKSIEVACKKSRKLVKMVQD